MGLDAHCLGAVGVQIQEAAPGIGKDCCPVMTGDISKEQGHGDGHGCGLYLLAGLSCTASEVPGLGP